MSFLNTWELLYQKLLPRSSSLEKFLFPAREQSQFIPLGRRTRSCPLGHKDSSTTGLASGITEDLDEEYLQ
ncbi:hypothetical protein Y1Q_0015163 [Alligator mississippiensis]|uniref:Uncharacterized protein n=1 Tax=Alligator mississippiensis TaxID=8496 RepID=A0A151P9C6_ALLMI|nr:hypothetical protein Y1Q_0015163 [Alligator mississippiensis]